MAFRQTILIAGILLATSLQARTDGTLLSGFSIRLHGGLNNLAGLDALNDGVSGMNQYLGTDGTWVLDAQGDDFGFDWAPYVSLSQLNNAALGGVSIEYELQLSDFTRLVLGGEYSGGGSRSSNLFAWDVTQGGTGTIWVSEDLDLSSMLLSARYSLKDLNLPLHAHIGLGLGMASLDSRASYIQANTVAVPSDPLVGEVAPQHTIEADFSGDTFAGRLFAGFEWDFGFASLMLDAGYDYMDFGALDGDTVTQLRYIGSDPAYAGEMINVQHVGLDDGRLELAPIISGDLRYLNALARSAFLQPVGVTTADDGSLWYTNAVQFQQSPREIEYDMSGGFVRFSVAYHF